MTAGHTFSNIINSNKLKVKVYDKEIFGVTPTETLVAKIDAMKRRDMDSYTCAKARVQAPSLRSMK